MLGMQNDIPIAANADEVTPAWLTKVLNANGYSATITAVTQSSIGTGQVGENVRFTLTGEGDFPATVVGKFASLDPVSRETGKMTNSYGKEVHFYKALRSRVDIQTPDIFFVDLEEATQDFIILMQDQSPGYQGDQIEGGSIEQARVAMQQIAKLHGPCWGADDLVHGEIITSIKDGDAGEGLKMLWLGVEGGFLERYADRLNDDEKGLVKAIGRNLGPYTRYDATTTLIHGDYRLDNMLFDGPYPLAVVDWQTTSVGCALQDVSYYMGTSLLPDDRRQVEDDLIRLYFDGLSGYDIDFSWDDCWHYYRHYAPAGLIMAVIASMIVGETERGNDMFMAMAKRSARMMADLDTIALLESSNA